VEAGPGRGTMMADALRAIGQVATAFGSALRVHLIETSARLRSAQAELVPGATWLSSLETLPNQPFVLLANEFLDALPIRQFVKRGNGWTERFVHDGRFVEAPTECREADGLGVGQGHVGCVVERNEPARAIARAIGARLAEQPGAALFLDYGPELSAAGDSLQALRDGRPANPLDAPGTADLTAHVDFEAFGSAAREGGAVIHGPISQGVFLARLGLFQRTDRLARMRPAAQAAELIEAARRLAEPDRMGRLFKAIALGKSGGPIPPGFE
jgi:NADH dehydrogenase [ubiquinone] 1 alpha subcomplex assembly factor 7